MSETKNVISETRCIESEEYGPLAPLQLEEIDIPLLCKAYQSLTAREREVADLMLGRCHPKRIGRNLNVSPATVFAHLGNIKTKLGATSLAELAVLLTIVCYESAGRPLPPNRSSKSANGY